MERSTGEPPKSGSRSARTPVADDVKPQVQSLATGEETISNQNTVMENKGKGVPALSRNATLAGSSPRFTRISTRTPSIPVQRAIVESDVTEQKHVPEDGEGLIKANPVDTFLKNYKKRFGEGPDKGDSSVQANDRATVVIYVGQLNAWLKEPKDKQKLSEEKFPFREFHLTSLQLAVLMDDATMVHGILEALGKGSYINMKDNFSVLHWAVGSGNIEIVKALLSFMQLRDVNKVNSYGNTALHWAVQSIELTVNIDIVEELLASRANVNIQERNGYTALHWAVKRGNEEIVGLLLSTSGIHVNEVDNVGKTALWWAVDSGKIDIVRQLLDFREYFLDKNGISWEDRVDVALVSRDDDPISPFKIALLQKNMDMVRELLRTSGINLSDTDHDHKTALHLAVEAEQIDIVEKVLSYRFPMSGNRVVCGVLDADARGNSALHYAVEPSQNDMPVRTENNKRIVQRLLLELKIDGRPFILHDTVQRGDVDIVRAVIICFDSRLAKWNDRDPKGKSAFHHAVEGGNIEIVRALLEQKDKLSLTQENGDGKTAIEVAIEKDLPHIRSVLMECDVVNRYVDTLYRDRQVYVDAANAILVGAALIASVTFAVWLQPPLGYTESFSGPPSSSALQYADLENFESLRVFWVFNCLSFYFAIGTVVYGACSVLPRRKWFIRKIVERLRYNLLFTSLLLWVSVLCVMVAFGIAGSIVLIPKLQFQWYMIWPTVGGGLVCVYCLSVLLINICQDYSQCTLTCSPGCKWYTNLVNNC